MSARLALRPLAAALLCMQVLLAGGAGAQGTARIRILSLPVDSGAQAFYAMDREMFARAGLDASVDKLANGGAIIAAVTSGAADVGYSNVFSLEQAFSHGAPITLIAGAGLAAQDAPTALIVVDKSSPIRTGKDLDGKVFGTDGLKTISEFAPRNWVDARGGDSSTVKFTELTFGDSLAALQTHRVDAVMLPEPFLTEDLSSVTVIGDAYATIAKQFLIGAWFTSTAWAQAHPDLVRRFAEVMRESAVWANANHADSATILAKNSRIDPGILGKMHRVRYATTLTPPLVQPTIDVLSKYHAIDAPFPASRMIYAAGR